MKRQRSIDILVGLFVLAAIISLILLALKVSGLANYSGESSYEINASFDNIGTLKPRAAVNIAGVKVGEVDSISLNPETYRADVKMHIYSKDKIPADSAASILTAGLLGSQYISLTPGFDETYLQQNGQIEDTNSALILEDLIGQLLFSMNSDEKAKKDSNN